MIRKEYDKLRSIFSNIKSFRGTTSSFNRWFADQETSCGLLPETNIWSECLASFCIHWFPLVYTLSSSIFCHEVGSLLLSLEFNSFVSHLLEDGFNWLNIWTNSAICFCCSYLLILDRTNWRTNMLTSLLVPYIFFSLPAALFHFLRWYFHSFPFSFPFFFVEYLNLLSSILLTVF